MTVGPLSNFCRTIDQAKIGERNLVPLSAALGMNLGFELMSEVMDRKKRMDTAIIDRDPGIFAKYLVSWLEATAYIKVTPTLNKLGLGKGVIPNLTEIDLREESIRETADDTVMAFCIVAGLNGDKEAFLNLHQALTKTLGVIYPGSSAVAHCNQVIDPIVTLDDAVGQVLKAMLDAKALDTKEIWTGGLRLLQRIRSSNFVNELTPVVARWLRDQWARAINQQRFNLVRPNMTVPEIEAALADSHNDQPFIAALLLASADAVDMDIDPEYRKQLASLALRG
jgi:hypothetical protein